MSHYFHAASLKFSSRKLKGPTHEQAVFGKRVDKRSEGSNMIAHDRDHGFRVRGNLHQGAGAFESIHPGP
jgi:hypothetical protein